MTFIRHAGVPKWIGILQFRLKAVQWQYFGHILCKFDGNLFSNPRDSDKNTNTNKICIVLLYKIGQEYEYDTCMIITKDGG